MKVLICAYSCFSESGVKFIGGEALLGWHMVLQLSKEHKVWVFTHGYNQKAIEQMLQKNPLPNANFCYIILPKWLSFLERFHGGGIQIYAYLWQIKAYFFARKLHKKINFDVFHHLTYANDWMASYIGAFLAVPYIRGPGGGAHRTPKSFLATYPLGGRIKEKIRAIGQWMFRHDPVFVIGQRKAKVILVCNNEAFNALPKKWQKKAQLFPVNGISTEDFNKYLPQSAINNAFSIITAGKLIRLKNFDLAIRAFKIFDEEFPNSKFSIIGDGQEKSNLLQLAKELKISDKVVFEGWIDRGQLLKRVSSADVFLFPSLRDGGGAVVVEAMALAKPVVCMDIGGPGFHIDGSVGIKVKPIDPNQAIKEMAAGLSRLYKSKNLRDSLGNAARDRVAKIYLWDKLGERMLKIYKENFGS
jgi:glycosyltransferase involved in cell wall biosynthesis